MNLDWLQVCAEGQTTPCVAPIQLAYLVALLVGAVLLAIIGRRSRDFTTAALTLMPVAIAINIAVGSITVALRLPIYLDSIGTVLVGALAGPWAGALTGHPVQPHLVDPADPRRRRADWPRSSRRSPASSA